MKRYIYIIAFLFLLLPAAALADIYHWTDSEGVMHITDDMDKVPLEYREQLETMATEPAVKGVKVEDVRAEKKAKKAEQELYGDRPLTWWRLSFNRLRSEVESAKKELAQKQQFVEIFRRGRRLGQRNEPEDVATFKKYLEEIPLIEKRLKANEKKLADLKRRATLSGVPRKIRK